MITKEEFFYLLKLEAKKAEIKYWKEKTEQERYRQFKRNLSETHNKKTNWLKD